MSYISKEYLEGGSGAWHLGIMFTCCYIINHSNIIISTDIAIAKYLRIVVYHSLLLAIS